MTGWTVVVFCAGHIQECLIDGDRFKEGSIVGQDCHHPARHFDVALPVARNKDHLRAEAQRLGRRHRRMYAESARFVGRRGNDAAHLGPPANNHRKSDQGGVVQPLDSYEEGVEVEMDDGTFRELLRLGARQDGFLQFLNTLG